VTKKYERMNRLCRIGMQPLFPDSPLRRILILGPSGSGKSTVGKRISKVLGIPAVHLDMHYWKPISFNMVSEPSFIRRELYMEMIERLSREYLRLFLVVIN
jgi:ATP-dependent protease HslVU (ClpYQ) ATPase subunit